MIFNGVVDNGCLLIGSDCQLAQLAIPIQSQLSERRSMDWYPITSVNVFLSLCPIFASFTLTFSNRFASCWTSLTAGAYSVVFLHSAWSKHPIASIGAQAIWIFLTWLFWIVGAGIVNTAASSFLLQRGKCGPHGVVYCGQIRALFSASHIFQILYHFYGIERLFFDQALLWWKGAYASFVFEK